MSASLVGSEMCIRDSARTAGEKTLGARVSTPGGPPPRGPGPPSGEQAESRGAQGNPRCAHGGAPGDQMLAGAFTATAEGARDAPMRL
eukprot:10720899-Alexandrium_andersonii.AAC.1